MTTNLSDVADLFLTRISDYRLNTIYQSSGSLIFTIYLEPWIQDAICEFDVCNQDLTYVLSTSTDEGYFVQTLTIKNKVILSQIMVKYWLAKEVQDVLQMNNALQDHDYRTFAQGANLQAKQTTYNNKREEISQLLNDYDYKNNDWTGWKAQNFDGS